MYYIQSLLKNSSGSGNFTPKARDFRAGPSSHTAVSWYEKWGKKFPGSQTWVLGVCYVEIYRSVATNTFEQGLQYSLGGPGMNQKNRGVQLYGIRSIEFPKPEVRPVFRKVSVLLYVIILSLRPSLVLQGTYSDWKLMYPANYNIFRFIDRSRVLRFSVLCWHSRVTSTLRSKRAQNTDFTHRQS